MLRPQRGGAVRSTVALPRWAISGEAGILSQVPCVWVGFVRLCGESRCVRKVVDCFLVFDGRDAQRTVRVRVVKVGESGG